MPHTDSPTGQAFLPRFRSRAVLRRNGIPDSRDILAKYVHRARARYYFIHRRRYIQAPMSVRAVADALEDRGSPSLITDCVMANELGTPNNLDADLLHVGEQFN